MPRGNTSAPDHTTLEMALVGYEIEKKRIEDKIREIRSLLGHSKQAATTGKKAAAPPAGKRRELSASARARIAAAQRKRWAEHHKKMAMAAKA